MHTSFSGAAGQGGKARGGRDRVVGALGETTKKSRLSSTHHIDARRNRENRIYMPDPLVDWQTIPENVPLLGGQLQNEDFFIATRETKEVRDRAHRLCCSMRHNLPCC